MDRGALELFENQLLEDVLYRVERYQRAVLESMNCPTAPVEIYRVLAGEAPAPWPKRTAKRDAERALYAMHALVLIAQTRGHLTSGEERPLAAAHAALLAGLHANAALAIVGEMAVNSKKRGGKIKGEQATAKATSQDAQIEKYRSQWENSEVFHEEYDSATAYIQSKTGLNKRTIQRALKRLQRA